MFKLFTTLIGDAINIAFVSYALNISLVKYLSNKHDYDIESNQELLSYGIGNIALSFFSGFPACAGLTRSLIVDGIGAKTQLYSIISCIIVLITFLGIGSLFQALPSACLAAIIVVSLLNKSLEVVSIVSIFKKSKLEACAWCVSFLGVIILDIDYGLYIGLGFSLLLVIIQTQIPSTSSLGSLIDTELYENVKLCSSAQDFNDIKIIRYEANLYYLNVDNFVYKVNKLSTVNPKNLINEINKLKELKGKQKIRDIEMEDENANDIDSILKNIMVKHIILDMSCVNYIDSMGIEAILTVIDFYLKLFFSFWFKDFFV